MSLPKKDPLEVSFKETHSCGGLSRIVCVDCIDIRNWGGRGHDLGDAPISATRGAECS